MIEKRKKKRTQREMNKETERRWCTREKKKKCKKRHRSRTRSSVSVVELSIFLLFDNLSRCKSIHSFLAKWISKSRIHVCTSGMKA